MKQLKNEKALSLSKYMQNYYTTVQKSYTQF